MRIIFSLGFLCCSILGFSGAPTEYQIQEHVTERSRATAGVNKTVKENTALAQAKQKSGTRRLINGSKNKFRRGTVFFFIIHSVLQRKARVT